VTYVDERTWNHDPWDDPDVTDALVLERPRRQRPSAKFFVWFFAYLALAGIVVVGVVGLWYTEQINPKGDPGAPITFTVKATDSLQSISERLQAKGLVESAAVFRWYVDHHGGLILTPGYYELRPRDHMGNLMHVLRTPPSQTYTKVTFPEGFTVAKIAARLAQKVPRLIAADFETAAASGAVRSTYQPVGITSLEGMLFPDTYQVSNGESVAQVAQRMVALMERVGNQEDIGAGAFALGLTPYQVLIVASMIEREAKVADDRPKIARVIYNRLALGMPLQIDATLLYDQPAGSSVNDLRAIDTPYNSYLHAGLPPTPIANPGRASIHAALHPTVNPSQGDPLCKGIAKNKCVYLYYVIADTDGHHVFAVTLAQHEANVQAARDKGLLG
jgi:UPF0755 protein